MIRVRSILNHLTAKPHVMSLFVMNNNRDDVHFLFSSGLTMFSWHQFKSTEEIEEKAKSVIFDDDEEEETLQNYETIRVTDYEDAQSAYENDERLNAYFYFTRYLHMTNQLSKMLKIQGIFFEIAVQNQ